MSNYATIVIRMPEDADGKQRVEDGLKLLQPFQTAMSIEDEMSVLELIEQHDDFPLHIAVEARIKTAKLHTAAEAASPTEA